MVGYIDPTCVFLGTLTVNIYMGDLGMYWPKKHHLPNQIHPEMNKPDFPKPNQC